MKKIRSRDQILFVTRRASGMKSCNAYSSDCVQQLMADFASDSSDWQELEVGRAV
jgi:hypothetical protein